MNLFINLYIYICHIYAYVVHFKVSCRHHDTSPLNSSACISLNKDALQQNIRTIFTIPIGDRALGCLNYKTTCNFSVTSLKTFSLTIQKQYREGWYIENIPFFNNGSPNT